MRDLLERRGVRVIEARSGRQAFSYLLAADVEPDVILLDVSMPDMDGNTLLKLLAELRRLSDVPVIVISATNAETLPLAAPVAVRLTKPVSEVTLLKALNEVSIVGV